ncbi:hypothetical protein BJY01DRAFT_214884 [Aspergillus pseudoustus]|uniref:DUF7728 domain-containing protein n=1 Tax=Aspergillus pseudoustus TaxID=1810923 RepID=A0ABR4JX14_9EURO
MTLRSLLLGSALALSSARAMLVVPDVDSEAFTTADIAKIQPVEVEASQQLDVDLLCMGCPFAIKSGDETSLSLKFTVDDGLLLANDRQIFPPAPPAAITAVERRRENGEESDPINLGYAVEMMPLPSPPEEPFDIVEVRFTVLDIDGYPVPLDTVAITLIHDAEGNLYVAGTNIEDTADRESWRKCGGKARCLRRYLMHRIRTMFATAKERLIGMFKGKSCDGPPPPFPPPPHPHGDFDRFSPFDENDGPHDGPHHGRPRPHHGHHPHPPYHDKFHKTWEHTLHRVMRFVVVPAILGVIAGLAASAIGMLVGQLAICMWRRYRRSSRKEAVEQGTVDEKRGLMTEPADEMPPAYTDENASEQVADKA